MVEFIGSSSLFEQHTRSKVLDELESLLPEITASSRGIEDSRGLSPELNRALGKTGAFRMMLPKAVGGENLHPLAALRVIETAAYADVSVGWTVMIAYGFNFLLGKFPEATIGKFLANGPDVLFRGALAPHGVAIPTDGGYVLSGQWPLASGNYDYEWVLATAMVMEDGKPRMTPHGPAMLTMAVPPESATFLDTWDSLGLRGSSSHDFVIKDVFVPTEMTADMFGAKSPWTEPAQHRLQFMMITGASHSAVCLGAAQGALDDVAALARNKRPAFGRDKLAQDPVFTFRLGELAARLSVIRDGVYSDQMASHDMASSGRTPTALEASKLGAVTALAHKECMAIIDQCVELSGSTGVYSKSPLQRRWRDIRTVCAHAGGRGMAAVRYQMVGAALVDAGG